MMSSSGSARQPGRLSAVSMPDGAAAPSPKAGLATPSSARPPVNKFAVYDLSEDRNDPPKTIHEAAERGNTAWCVRTIERTLDFDINCRDRLMRTALHWAAEMGHHDTAKTLLDFGVELTTLDCTGRTAVHLAAKGGDAEMLSLLLQGRRADDVSALLNQGDHNDITPVFLAIQRGEEGQAAFEFLLQHGAHYNEPASTDGGGGAVIGSGSGAAALGA
ncbi:MAG: ankyrin repeat-containing domain protein [Monoraphidium minutum]|nr:MAG: ankyrin repeat-containing domain protein [Monoraphidium minutum]